MERPLVNRMSFTSGEVECDIKADKYEIIVGGECIGDVKVQLLCGKKVDC